MRPVPDVRALLFPRSLAVVGASPRNVDAVETVVRSRVRAWGVNPNRDEVAGLECFPSFADLPETPETALLFVNHERVEQAFEDAAAAGVRAFVVPGVGAEAGAAAGPTVARLAARARELGAAMVGPNCMGVVVPDGPMAWIGRAPTTTAPGHVAVLCQSGSVADAFLSLGGRVGSPLHRLLRRRGRHRRGRLPLVLRRGRWHPGGGALPRDRPSPRRVRRRARAVRARREDRGLPQGRALGGGRARRAVPHRCARRLRPSLLRRAPPVRRGRGRGLPRARRDARAPGSRREAGRHPDRRDLGVGRRVRPPRRPGGSRRIAVRAALGRPRRSPSSGVPELPRAGEPARRVGRRRRERRLPALARAAG